MVGGKKVSSTTTAGGKGKEKVKEGGSEIDDIFSTSSVPKLKVGSSGDKVDKKAVELEGEGKKRKRSSQTSKTRKVQIITDTSNTHSTPLPTAKSTKPSTAVDLEDFTDSRGTSGRKKTEDGLRIFSAAELRLGEGNGDTPDCPFDCFCCY